MSGWLKVKVKLILLNFTLGTLNKWWRVRLNSSFLSQTKYQFILVCWAGYLFSWRYSCSCTKALRAKTLLKALITNLQNSISFGVFRILCKTSLQNEYLSTIIIDQICLKLLMQRKIFTRCNFLSSQFLFHGLLISLKKVHQIKRNKKLVIIDTLTNFIVRIYGFTSRLQ